MKRPLLIAILLCAGSSWVSALQIQPGSSAAFDIGLLGNSLLSPPNPASVANAGSRSFAMGYSGLLGIGGYLGTSVRARAILPNDYGVSSIDAHFLSAPSISGIGTFGSGSLSIAKQLYPNLSLGLGLGLAIGEANRFDWGLGLNLGAVGRERRLGPLRNFRWSVSLDGLGKPFDPLVGSLSPVPSFTPALSSSFTLYQRGKSAVDLGVSLRAPEFQDLRIGVGAALTETDRLAVRLQGTFDLRELLLGEQAFPLSGGVGITLKLGSAPVQRTNITPTVAVTPVAPNLYALGASADVKVSHRDNTAPVVKVGAPKISYISPNGDGIKDSLVVPVAISDKGYIAGYRMTVYGPGGSLVRTVHGPSLSVAPTGSQGFFDRLAYVKRGIPLPKSIQWDGTNNRGRTVGDGRYTYTVTAWDAAGNQTTSAPRVVIVDTKPPQIKLTVPAGNPAIFSPDGDGYKDTLRIVQSGSKESLWTGTLRNSAGVTVRTFTWRNSPPETFVWNGRGSEGTVLPDGTYSYTVSSTDRAGNSASATVSNIVIDTRHPRVRLDINRNAISPGTSSPDQVVEYRLTVPNPSQVVRWQLEITDAKGTPVRRVEGRSAVPASYSFNGMSSSGHPLPDGRYGATLQVVYTNGAHSRAQGAVVRIDRTAPTAHVSAPFTVFSPIGSGARSAMTFEISASTEPRWTGTIATGGGTVVEHYRWTGKPPAKISWNGRGPKGRVEPDGTYQFSISATDEAGNFGQSNVVSFVLDSRSKHLLLSTNYAAFSPNGIRNVIRIIPDVRSPKGLDSYRIVIKDGAGKVFGSFAGTGVPTGSFAWNGLGPGDKPVPAGSYQAQMTAHYANGSVATAKSPEFAVITTLPHLSASVNYHLFSPNGDGHRDTVTFRQHSRGGERWIGKIQTSTGKTVLEKHWQGRLPASFTWNGSDSVGNTVANGSYSYLLTTVDRAGNPAEVRVSGIVVDNRHTQVYISAESSGFSPNGDGVDDSISFNTVEKPGSAAIASWSISILDSKGQRVRSWSGTGAAPSSPTVWNGSLDSGGIAPDGRYSARFVVHYRKGDVDSAKTADFLLVAHPPKVSVSLSPQPFVPAPGHPLSIGLSVDSPAPIARWRMVIYTPPLEHRFAAFSGLGSPPQSLSWDGRSDSGSLVLSSSVYSFHFTVVDSLGNERLLTGNIKIGPGK